MYCSRHRFRPALPLLCALLLLVSHSLLQQALAGGAVTPAPLVRELALRITPEMLAEGRKRTIELPGSGPHTLHTTIEPELQAFLLRKTQGNISPLVVVCCIDPVSGRVLAMAESNKEGRPVRLTTGLLAPAASIFKIVAAAGAIERCGADPGTKYGFNGRKHTLYRKQLTDKVNRWTQFVTLETAFAQSINPVFGKIGIDCLGREGLLESARRFGWGMRLDFELPVAESVISVAEEPYNWAEVASGFNRQTRITVLHGAMMAAAIANDGVMMRPSFIDTVTGPKGNRIYQSPFGPILRPVSAETAKALRAMMQKTVKTGTARKSFRGWRRDKVLKRLEIGGKTGTIDSPDRRYRYDWFCGYASAPQGRSLAVAALVVHQDVLGFKAARLARMAIRKFFELEMQKATGKKTARP